MSALNRITLWIFLGFWPVWLVWEIALLIMRGAGVAQLPSLISMVARDRGWSLSSVVYLWFGLGAHFWANTDKVYPGATNTILSISFWVIAVALLVWDITLWRTDFVMWSPVLRWFRWPVAWMIAGALSGRFLFPQAGRAPWN